MTKLLPEKLLAEYTSAARPADVAAPACGAEAVFVRLGAMRFLADPSGVLFEPQARLLVVADLHLEKGSAFAARGVLLPPWDTRATLRRLAATIARLQPDAVIALGDSFHDVGGPARLDPQDRTLLADLRHGRDWLWVTGNHDPAIPPELGGASAAVFRYGGVTFRHAPDAALTEADGVELCGHLHPVARLRVRGRSLRRRCFAVGERRCILPAFGAYAGGLNVRDAAFAPLFPNGLAVRVLGEQRVFAPPMSLLLPD